MEKQNKISKMWKNFDYFLLGIIYNKTNNIQKRKYFKSNLIYYLSNIKNHYNDLTKLMSIQNKEKYKNEHLGKTKFISLLLMKIIRDDF